jgi:hypothetical protein
MSKEKKKKPTDINLMAAAILKEATEPEEPAEKKPTKEPEPEKNPAAVALGRLGGLKGGKARAEKLSPEDRKRIASDAAKARWAKKKEEK